MKWILFLSVSLLAQVALAESSRVLPVFIEAAETYQSEQMNYLTLRPEIRSVIEVFNQHKIDPSLLEGFYSLKNDWTLPEDDKYDSWIKNPTKKLSFNQDAPAVSLQALKIDVVKSSQMSDDVYAYFFVTDGVMPTGKVTSIYKGVSSGESFFFNPIDRAIFPLIGVPAKSPSNHLIVDYGIIESDGDDIAKLQKLSSIIIDLAIAVYTTQDPTNGAKIANLRKEIKLLAEYILSQNNDDRLITDSFGFQTEEISSLLSNKTYHEFKKNYKHESTFYWWEYNVHFRLLK